MTQPAFFATWQDYLAGTACVTQAYVELDAANAAMDAANRALNDATNAAIRTAATIGLTPENAPAAIAFLTAQMTQAAQTAVAAAQVNVNNATANKQNAFRYLAMAYGGSMGGPAYSGKAGAPPQPTPQTT